MCVQIPLLVEKVDGEKVIVEGGRILVKQKNQKVNQGSFVIAFGNIVVAVLSISEAEKVRKALKQVVVGTHIKNA